MLIIEYKDNEYGFGLEWHSFTIIDKRKVYNKVKSLCDKEKQRYGVYISALDDYSIGLLPEGLTSNSLSAATGAANTYINGLFCFPLNDNSYWLCHVENGLVIEGRDVVLSFQEAVERLKLTFSFVSEQLALYGDKDVWSRITDKEIKDITLQSFIVSVQGNTSKIRALPYYVFITQFAFVSAVALITLVVSIILVFAANRDPTIVESIDPIKEWGGIVMDARKRFFSELSDYSRMQNTRSFIGSVMTLIKPLPVIFNGWRLHRVVCSNGDRVCHVFYANNGYGTYKTFSVLFDPDISSYSPGGKDVSVTLVLASPTHSSEMSPEYFHQSIPSYQEFYINDLSAIQHIEISQLISFSPTDNSKNITFEPLDNPSNPGNRDHEEKPVVLKSWKIIGELMYYIADVAQYISTTAFITESVTINFKKEQPATWSLEGYYAHK